jgi:hypothetical protein
VRRGGRRGWAPGARARREQLGTRKKKEGEKERKEKKRKRKMEKEKRKKKGGIGKNGRKIGRGKEIGK